MGQKGSERYRNLKPESAIRQLSRRFGLRATRERLKAAGQMPWTEPKAKLDLSEPTPMGRLSWYTLVRFAFPRFTTQNVETIP